MISRLTTVVRTEYIHRAYFLRELLSSSGIDSVIINQGIEGGQPESEIELQVGNEDVPRALEIFDEVNPYKQSKTEEEPNKIVTTIKNILVPVDFSQFSLNAAKYALQVAYQKEASIMFIHAFYDEVSNPLNYENFYSYPAELGEARRDMERDADEKMENFMSILKKFMQKEGISEIRPRQRIMSGTAEDVVLSAIEAEDFDLVIVGSRNAVPSDSWFSDFTSSLIEKLSIPVLAIPEDAVYKKTKLKKLMYATNFDKSDGLAIRKLLSIAAPLDSQVHVVHIDLTDKNPFINFDLAHFKEKYIGKIENIQMFFDLIVNESIIAGIENYIGQKNIDILAITSHKRNIITSFIKPSITRELLFRIQVPLLVFHSNS
jgi:nucleotide-binding universal stress UspA family protein